MTRILFAIALAAASPPLSAQMTRRQAVAGTRKVEATEMDPTYRKRHRTRRKSSIRCLPVIPK